MSVYEIITEKILEQLERGTIPWRKPWSVIPPQNAVSRKPYRGINALLLNSLAFESPFFITFKQARDLGGFVRKGERGFPVVFWTFVEKEGEEKRIPLLRYYTVFNLSQVDGMKAPTVEPRAIRPIDRCEEILSSMPNPPSIAFGGNRASYSPAADRIALPCRERFNNIEEFYSTAFHELIHSTGHKKRLSRSGITEDVVSFGSDSYSREELVAELGASFLCGNAGIATATVQNSASYIASWLSALQNDKRLIISAAGQAQKAVDYVLGEGTASE